MFSKRAVFIVFMILSLAACSTGAATEAVPVTPVLSDNGLTAEPVATENVVAPVVTQPPAVDPTAICPQAAADAQAYVSRENGFCFLVPASMKAAQPDYMHPGDVIAFVGPPNDPNSMEPLAAAISVSINAPAEGLDSAGYAQKWMEMGFGSPPPADLGMTLTDATIGGLPAAVVTNVPGMARQQVGFVVANGYRYTVTVFPQPGDYDAIDDQVNAAWKTVTESIVFFPPSVARTAVSSDSVCPKPTANTVLHVGNLDGVCFLVPSTFGKIADFANGYQGPAVLGDIFGRPLNAELVLGDGGPVEGKTPRQLFEPRLVNQEVSQIDVAGAQDTTLSGFPAIVWTEGEPLSSRQAIIVANGHMYTIVNQPYNDPDYVGGEADVELVWQTVTSSLAFFTPFR